MKKKKEFDLGTITGTCVDYSHEGKGVIRTEKKPVFVDGLIIGETADVKLTFDTSTVTYGKIAKLHNLSPNRIKPVCPVGSACGGCCFQGLKYEEQLAFKKRKVEEAFRKIARMNIKVDEIIGMENPYNYRNKIQMPIGMNQKKEIISGFYRTKSHEIIPIDQCYIEDERAAIIISKIKMLMKKHKIQAYNEDKHEGIIRHLLIRTSHYKKQIMVVLITNGDSFPGRNNLVKDIHKECPEISTIVQSVNMKQTNIIMGTKENILMGKGFIEDSLCGVNFRISAKSFFQVNSVQTEKLYENAINKAGLTGKETILDAYCGIGTIGLIASKKAKEVVGIEIIEEAIIDAKANARLNEIKNASFYAGDASDFMLKSKETKAKYDVVFVDPPRKGLDHQFVKSLLTITPTKIVYVSCDPSTLARDVAALSETYEVKTVSAVDMFPMTFHVETICLLERK